MCCNGSARNPSRYRRAVATRVVRKRRNFRVCSLTAKNTLQYGPGRYRSSALINWTLGSNKYIVLQNHTRTGDFTLRRTLALLIAIVALSPVAAYSQTRKRNTAATSAAQKTTETRRLAAVRVADHIKNMTRFIYLLGGVAKGIEQTDAAIKANQAPPAIVEQSKKNKTVVISSLRTWREAMDKLEIDFRSTADLQRYYIKLAGAASSAATAEDQATAGRYEQSGRTLLEVVNRLTDVLVEMR